MVTPVSNTTPIVVVFDGARRLCRGLVDIVLRRDAGRRFRPVALQSSEGRRLLAGHGLNADTIDSVAVIERGRVLVKSAAVFYLCRGLGGIS